MYKMGLLGKKVGMTHIYTDEGLRRPVSVIQVGPCVVLDKRTPERDGYASLQLGFDEQKPSRVSRPSAGRFKKAETGPKRFVHEIRLAPEALESYQVGQVLNVTDVFASGDMVDVSGTSRGKGFQGVMKKYHFAGFRSTHGVHEYFRHGGSIGCRLTPGRVVKGKKMPGQLGNKKVTIQNLQVVEVRQEDGLLLIQGGVPGGENAYLTIRYAQKKPLPARVSA